MVGRLVADLKVFVQVTSLGYYIKGTIDKNRVRNQTVQGKNSE